MNTIKLLLGATVALLVAAVILSWQGMNRDVKNAPPDEITRLQKQVRELRAEQDLRQLEKQKQSLAGASTPASAGSTAELDAMKLQVEQNKRALEEIESQKEKDTRDSKVAQDEEGLLAQRGLESADNELRRARLISQSLLVGKVTEFIENAEYGDFVTFEILMAEQVKAGAIVAIRRKTGILGQLKVSEVSPEGAIANPLPGFGTVKPQIGDELILPPQY
jgi:hypothetical protein